MQTVLSALSWLIYISNSKEEEEDRERITLLFVGCRVGQCHGLFLRVESNTIQRYTTRVVDTTSDTQGAPATT